MKFTKSLAALALGATVGFGMNATLLAPESEAIIILAAVSADNDRPVVRSRHYHSHGGRYHSHSHRGHHSHHGHYHGHYHRHTTVWTFDSAVAWVLLPIFLFDGEVDSSVNGMDMVDLIDNGYSEEEAQLIFDEQGRLMEGLVDAEMQIKIEAGDTVDTVKEALSPYAEGLDDVYVQYLIDFAE